MFCKKGVLKTFTKFTGKHMCQSFFVNKGHFIYRFQRQGTSYDILGLPPRPPAPLPLHQNLTLKVKPCLVQSSYLTISWLPLQSVGTANSIHILRSNAMLKSYSLRHVDHYALDIDSIFCDCQTMEARESNV